MTNPILLRPPCILVTSTREHVMDEPRPVTVQGLYKRLFDEVVSKVLGQEIFPTELPFEVVPI